MSGHQEAGARRGLGFWRSATVPAGGLPPADAADDAGTGGRSRAASTSLSPWAGASGAGMGQLLRRANTMPTSLPPGVSLESLGLQCFQGLGRMGKGGKKRRATAKDLAMLSAEAAAEGSAEPPEGLAGGVRANVRAAGETSSPMEAITEAADAATAEGVEAEGVGERDAKAEGHVPGEDKDAESHAVDQAVDGKDGGATDAGRDDAAELLVAPGADGAKAADARGLAETANVLMESTSGAESGLESPSGFGETASVGKDEDELFAEQAVAEAGADEEAPKEIAEDSAYLAANVEGAKTERDSAEDDIEDSKPACDAEAQELAVSCLGEERRRKRDVAKRVALTVLWPLGLCIHREGKAAQGQSPCGDGAMMAQRLLPADVGATVSLVAQGPSAAKIQELVECQEP